MKTIPFWKMSGSGNDFILIDNRRHLLGGSLGAWAKRLCHRQFGIGADGLLLLENDPREDFRMVYFNADGSRADMCGNGARCMAYFARAKRVVSNVFRFRTDAYAVGATVNGSMVQVNLADAREYNPQVLLRVGGRTYRPAFVNTGVPHAVLFVTNADKVFVSGLGRALRFHRVFRPQGANVNFVQKIGPQTLRVRTYERGVEGETLACGTGVTASAIAAALRGIVKPPVRCIVSGGDTLIVDFKMHKGNHGRPASGVSLRGPVRLTFQGEIHV